MKAFLLLVFSATPQIEAAKGKKDVGYMDLFPTIGPSLAPTTGTPPPTMPPSFAPSHLPTSTLMPSVSQLPTLSPTLSPAPTPLTPKPTEIPTFSPPEPSNAAAVAAAQAIGVCFMFFALGALLGVGNLKLENDRRARKASKVSEFLHYSYHY